jgi:hypothetical protein
VARIPVRQPYGPDLGLPWHHTLATMLASCEGSQCAQHNRWLARAARMGITSQRPLRFPFKTAFKCPDSTHTRV